MTEENSSMANATTEKAPKKVKEAKEKVPRKIHGFADTAKITVLAKENPKRGGSSRAIRFSKYKTGMTVRQYLDAGGKTSDIKVDSEAGHIKIAA